MRMNYSPAAATIIVAGTMFVLVSVVMAKGKGTTAGLKEIVIGRCLDYNGTMYDPILPRVTTKCSKLWEDFSKAFKDKDPCNVTVEDYQQFLRDSLQDLPNDKVLFWNGVKDFAHRFANEAKKYITLEDTLHGFFADRLYWCRKYGVNTTFNYNACPDCAKIAVQSYWSAASRDFARRAKGPVTVMLNGSHPDYPAYNETACCFGRDELPNLNNSQVPSLRVIVVHDLNKEYGKERCSNGSLVQLQKDVEARGLKFTCEDNPRDVLHLLCSDDPKNPQCKFAKPPSPSCPGNSPILDPAWYQRYLVFGLAILCALHV